MNKKVTRILIALCLLLVMSSSTVFAATTKMADASSIIPANKRPDRIASFDFAILTKNDKITKNAKDEYCNARFIGNVLISYDSTGKAKLSIKDAAFKGIKVNASEYSYEIENDKFSPDRSIRVHMYRNGWKIGHLHISMYDNKFTIDWFNDKD